MGLIISVLLFSNPIIASLVGMEWIVFYRSLPKKEFFIKTALLYFFLFNIIYFSKAWFYISLQGVLIIYLFSFIGVYELFQRLFKVRYETYKQELLYFVSSFVLIGFGLFYLPYWVYSYWISLSYLIGYMVVFSFFVFWMRAYRYFFMHKSLHIKEMQNIYLLLIISIVLCCLYLAKEILIRS